jgi:hypothetical protein
MKRLLLSIAVVCAIAGSACLAAGDPARKPKLVLAVVIDQFRYDYLLRFRADYHAGLDRLLTRGAVFTDAHYPQAATVTAVGHSTIGDELKMSGAESRVVSVSIKDRSAVLPGGHMADGAYWYDADFQAWAEALN